MKLRLLLIAQDILIQGKIDALQVEMLRQQLCADGTIDRANADFLIELYKRLPPQTPVFKHFVYRALKDYLLTRERIGAEEAEWLRHTLFADGAFEEEREFLHELKGEARTASPEFEALFK